MRVTLRLQSHHSNFCRKIFYCQFSQNSTNELKTDFNLILSCKPDDGFCRYVIFSCEPVDGPLDLFSVDTGSDTWCPYSYTICVNDLYNGFIYDCVLVCVCT